MRLSSGVRPTDPGTIAESSVELLCAATRIGRADAALLKSVGGEMQSVFGLNATVAEEFSLALDAGSELPGGWVLLWECTTFTDDARTVTLFLLGSRAHDRAIDESTERALRILADRVGSLVDEGTSKRRSAMQPPLDERTKQLAAGIDTLPVPVAIMELRGGGRLPMHLCVNPAYERFWGYAQSELTGKDLGQIFGPLTDRERVASWGARLRAGHEVRGVLVCYKRDGTPAWIDVHVRPITEPNGLRTARLFTFSDVTARMEFEAAIAAEKEKLKVTLAAIGDAVVTTVGDGRIDYVNDAARRMWDIDLVSWYGEPINAAVPLVDADGVTIDLLASGEEDELGVRRGQGRLRSADGVLHIAYVVAPIGKAKDGYVVVLRDITAQHHLATQLSYEAAHDPLTGLPNRRRFEEALEDLIAQARDPSMHTMLAYLDLDRFKVINDRCGHAAGDRVLIEIAETFAKRLRGHDLLARVGGDEFAILLGDCTLENARRVLQELRSAVSDYRFVHGGETFRVGVSVGLVPVDEKTVDGASALAAADAACYSAKAVGGNAVVG